MEPHASAPGVRRVAISCGDSQGDLADPSIAVHVACRGKGRENRVTPLDAQTVAVLRAYNATLPTGSSVAFPPDPGPG